MKTRSVVYGSMMVLLAACSGSADDGAEGAGTEGANPPAAAASESSNAAPGAPPAEQTPASPAPPSGPAPIAPAVTAMIPADGAKGVMLTPMIEITFSRSMDRATTEAAFSLEGAGAGAVAGAFSWADDDKVLKFEPHDPVANGTTLSAKVGTGAKDKQGTNLPAPVSSSFLTLRKTTVDLAAGTIVQCTATGLSIYVGQFFVGDDAANKEQRSFVTFDLSTLPSDITSIDAASLSLRNGSAVGKSTAVVAESVDYGPSIDCASDFAAAPRAIYNPFTKKNVVLRSAIEAKDDALHAANLTTAVAMDWNERQTLGARSMLRIQAAELPPADGVADGMKWDGTAKLTRPTLTITFQHP